MTKPFTVTQLRCLELARIIREGLEGVRFDMSDYRNNCGTAGCIAGYTIAYYQPRDWAKGDYEAAIYFDEASRLLGLDQKQAYSLFIPWYWGGLRFNDITPAMAAATLENYALTGKVEWPEP